VTAGENAILVTGASTGIGAATVRAFARKGWTAYAGVRNDADAALATSWDPHVRAVRLDVTEPASIATAASRVSQDGVALRGVVCNAGIAVGGPLEFVPVDALRHVFEVNVFGAVAVGQAFLPALRSTQGRLILMGSIGGRLAMPLLGPYAASKFALRAIADAWRQELRAASVRVSLIEPGSVKTPIWEKGRASRAALLELVGSEGIRYYGDELARLFAMTEREERTGMPVERVVEAVEHAMTSRRPRASYLVGAPARAGSIVAMLPARLRDAALGRAAQRPK
jgi:NAD(P)-dependent dehydrogenase (short-subunit alcohol dehydrogenase family)